MDFLCHVTIAGRVKALRSIRRALRDSLKDTQAVKRLNDVLLATDEAAQNIIHHAFKGDDKGEIIITAFIKHNVLHIWLEDNAPLTDLNMIKPRNLDNVREHGLGVHFIRTISDKAIWSHKNGRNHLDMRWDLS